MPDAASLGAISVDIRADWSKLAGDFSAAEAAAARAGSTIAGAFSSSVKAANGLVDQFGRSIQSEAAAASAANASNAAFSAGTASAGNAAAASATQVQGLTAAQQQAAAAAQQAATVQYYAAQTIGTVGAAATQATGAVTASGAAASGASGGYLRLYAAISLVRGALDAIDKLRQAEENLKNVAAATGISAERLAAFQGAVQRSGGDGEAFGRVLGRLARAEDQAAEGNAKMQDDLRRLGITAKDPIQAFYQLADTVHNTSQPFEALGAAERVTGRGSVELIGILSQGSAALRDAAEASGEYAAAMAGGIAPADELTRTLAELKQQVAIIAAEAFPAINTAIKVTETAFTVVAAGARLFFSALFDEAVLGVTAMEQFGTVASDVLSGKFGLAAADAKTAIGTIRSTAQEMLADVAHDAQASAIFLDKLWNPPAIAAGAGVGKPFPGPAQTGSNKAGEIEDQAEVAQARALQKQKQDIADTALAIQKGHDLAMIESMEDEHARASAIAAEDVSIAAQRATLFKQYSDEELATAQTALTRKAQLQAQDGKNAGPEIQRTAAAIIAEQNRARDEQIKLIEDVAKAAAHSSDVQVIEQRKASDEWVKVTQEAATKSLAIVRDFQKKFAKAQTEAAKIGGETAVSQLKGAELASQRQLALGAPPLTANLGRQAEAAANERQQSIEAQMTAAHISALNQEKSIQDSLAQKQSLTDEERNTAKVRAVALEDEISKTAQDGANKVYQLETQRLQLLQQMSLQYQILRDFSQAFQSAQAGLGQGVAAGLFHQGKGGEDIGQQIEKSLRNVGQQLVGSVLTQTIQRLVTVIVTQTGLQAAWNAIFPVHATAQVAASTVNSAALTGNTTAVGANTAAVAANTVALGAQSGASAASGAGGFVSAFKAILGFAGGGRPPVNQLSWVGEKGPELFVPDSAGTIIPADKIGSSAAAFGPGGAPALPSFPGINSSSSSVSFQIANMNLHGVQNTRELAREMARELPNVLKPQGGPAFSRYSRAGQGPGNGS